MGRSMNWRGTAFIRTTPCLLLLLVGCDTLNPRTAAPPHFVPSTEARASAPQEHRSSPGAPNTIQRASLGLPIDALPPDAHVAGESPFSGMKEMRAEALVEQVLARNPSLAQMIAAWQAAAARYPQVTSLEDPMLGAKLGPGSFGSNTVDFAYTVELAQKFPFPGKLGLKGQSALA